VKERVKTKKIYVGDVAVGGDAPISVQSMTYSDTHNVYETVEQINRLHFAGADMGARGSTRDGRCFSTQSHQRTNITPPHRRYPLQL